MSDRIAVFNHGKIQQCASPREVYDHPSNRFVAEFIGETNIFTGKVQASEGNRVTLTLANGVTVRSRAGAGLVNGAEGLLSLRPERMELLSKGESRDGYNAIAGTITDSVYQGNHLRLMIGSAFGEITAHLDRKSAEWVPGTEVSICFRPEDSWVITP